MHNLLLYIVFTEPTKSIELLCLNVQLNALRSTGGDRLAKLNTFVNDPTGVAISQNPGVGSPRGTVDGNDSYATFTIKLRYIFIPGFNALRFIEQISYKLGVGRGMRYN
jgi:hypothetical protein